MSIPIIGIRAELDSEVVYFADVNDREIQRQIKQQVEERLKQTEDRLLAAIQREPGEHWRQFGKKLIASYLPQFGAVIVATSTVIVGLSYFVKPDIAKLTEQVTTIQRAVEKQEQEVRDLNKDIREMLNNAINRAYPDKTSFPAKSEAQTRGALNDARGIIALAARTGVPLPPESLTKVGSRALGAC